MHRAVVDHAQERIPPFRLQSRRLDDEIDGADAVGVLSPGVVAADLESIWRHAMPAQEALGKEGDAGGKAGHEHLARRGTCIISPVAGRLVGVQLVSAHRDAQPIAARVRNLDPQMNSVIAPWASASAMVAPAGTSRPSIRSSRFKPSMSIVIWHGTSLTPISRAISSSSCGLAT